MFKKINKMSKLKKKKKQQFNKMIKNPSYKINHKSRMANKKFQFLKKYQRKKITDIYI